MNRSDWMSQEYIEAGHYLLKLVRAALLKEDAPDKPQDVSWKKVFLLARHNSIAPLAYYGVLHAPEPPEPGLLKAWKGDLLHTVCRQTRLDEDRRRLARAMDQHDIDYLFMKGIFIQTLYPETGMRQMSDNDILYRHHESPDPQLGGASQKAMSQLTEELCMKELSTDGIVDVYLAGDTSLFEMHREFLGPDQPLYAYFEKIWQRALPQENCREYRLTAEDHYILMLAHSHKHFSSGGCGPREIIDAWQYRRVLEPEMNWEYVQDQLAETGLTEYEGMLRQLGSVIFEDAPGTEEDWQMLDFFLGCGTYGSRENAIRNTLAKLEDKGKSVLAAKASYVWGRLFPEPAYLKTHFPFFYRHRWLSGFLLFYRAGRGLTVKRDRLFSEFRDLKKI